MTPPSSPKPYPTPPSPPGLLSATPYPRAEFVSHLSLEECPSLDRLKPFLTNNTFAKKLLALEANPSSFEKSKKALELLELSTKQRQKLDIQNGELSSCKNSREVLIAYLINVIILPLCLEGFIHVEELLPYKSYLPYVCQSFIEPSVRLIDPSLEDLVKNSLANALKQEDMPFQDYTQETIENLILNHPIQLYPLGALRFIDRHCTHLGYRPLLSKLVKGLLKAIESINIEEMSQSLEANLFPMLHYFLFFTYHFSNSLQLYGSPVIQTKDDLPQSLPSFKQDQLFFAKNLEACMAEILAYLYALNSYIMHALKQHNSSATPSTILSLYEGSFEQILYCLNTQVEFADLYQESSISSPGEINKKLIAASAKEAIDYLQAHFQ